MKMLLAIILVTGTTFGQTSKESTTASSDMTWAKNVFMRDEGGCTDWFHKSANGKTCQFTITFAAGYYKGLTCTALVGKDGEERKMVCSFPMPPKLQGKATP